MKLSGRCALVTGGSRGIGRAIALALAGAGADVAIIYRRQEASARETVAQVQALGRRAFAFQADVSDPEAVKAAAEQALAALGHVDILANNAGIQARGDPVISADLKAFRRVMEVDAYGPLYVTQAVLPQMRQQGRGDVIFISSGVAVLCTPGLFSYSMAKRALEALALTLAQEERPYGIRVNVVAPGLTDTDMGQAAARFIYGKKDMKELYPQLPFGRSTLPSDIGNMCAFLCSPEAEYISGQVIHVNGGNLG